jgi:hypothetical protein
VLHIAQQRTLYQPGGIKQLAHAREPGGLAYRFAE